MEKIFRDSHQVDRVVCVSNATREDLISYYGVPPSKVSVVHPGVDPDPLLIDGANDDDELQALSLVADGYFLVLGTIEPRKNVELVVDYVASNPSTLNTHKFVFAGRNGWGRTFQTICSTRGLMDPRVMHFGYVSESQRRLLLRNCAALLFPSWFEGFGLPILEAMAAGVPVIASRSSSIIEVGGDPLLAFEPGSTDSFSNAIDAFVRMNASDRKTLKVACMKHAANFSWHRFAEQVAGACIRN
jgi:alpha-1,3-rhamnosyl/mannosyltransferase